MFLKVKVCGLCSEELVFSTPVIVASVKPVISFTTHHKVICHYSRSSFMTSADHPVPLYTSADNAVTSLRSSGLDL